MKKIFVLEDDPNRHKRFKKAFPGLMIAEEVELAKMLFLTQSSYDMIFLDHDLGGETFVDSSHPNTGYGFVSFLIASKPHFTYNRIIIHSLNPAGAQAMYNKLVDNGFERVFIRPFTTLFTS